MRDIFNKKLVLSLLVVCFGVFIISPVYSAIDLSKEYGLSDTLNTGTGEGSETLRTVFKNQKPSEIIGTIIGAALAFIGVLFFVLIVYGGFLWMTARGKEERYNQAKEYIYQAIIGLIIVSAAYLLTKYIGQAVIDALVAPSSSS